MSRQAQTSQPSDFIVDPARDGVANALWKFYTGAGALSAATPDQFRFNADDAVVRADVLHGILDFSVRLPLTGVQTPTDLTNDISFGLKNQSLGNLGKIELFFDQSADAVHFRTYDDFGTLKQTVVTFDTAWNDDAQTIFRLSWAPSHVSLEKMEASDTAFTFIASHKDEDADTGVPTRPLNPFVTVVGAENLDVDFIGVKRAVHSSIMLI